MLQDYIAKHDYLDSTSLWSSQYQVFYYRYIFKTSVANIAFSLQRRINLTEELITSLCMYHLNQKWFMQVALWSSGNKQSASDGDRSCHTRVIDRPVTSS
jgi:hypothetical protein